jgi:hypothetical protein
MNTIYVVTGSEDGILGTFLTKEAAIELAIDYVEQNGDRAVVDVIGNYVSVNPESGGRTGTADVYAHSTNWNPMREEYRNKKQAKKTIRERAGTKDMTNMQKKAIATARKVAVTMSTDAFPIEIVEEKIEFTSMGDIWFTMDTKNTNAPEGSYLDMVDSVHWFMNITRRGKVTIHQGPHWANKGTDGMHAAKDGYFS